MAPDPARKECSRPVMVCVHCSTPIPDEARFCHSCGSLVSDAEGQAAATASMDQSSFMHMERLLREDTQGEFEVGRLLGRGGMAVVYMANEVHLSRKVAIKVLPPELTFGHGVERFKREAKTAAALDHPNIIPIYRIASGGKVFWYAMKFLEGRSLEDLLKEQGKLPLDETLQIMRQVADALDYAHEHQVIHRDIKPANVMLDGRNRVVVTDFGIAKALTEGTLTASGSVIGTPYFMSPEQGKGMPVTGKSDQYSVAVMAYRMLAGQVPFEGDSAIEILHKHCMFPAPNMEEVAPGLPPHVYRAIDRALRKAPEERFDSVSDFVEGLANPAAETEASSAATIMVMPRSAPAPLGTGPQKTMTPRPGAPKQGARLAPAQQKGRGALWGGIAAAVILIGGGIGAWVVMSGGSREVAGTGTAAVPPVVQPQAAPLQDTAKSEAPAAEPEPAPSVPAGNRGTVRVTNLPAGAVVTADGRRQQGAEFALVPGQRTIRIEAQGFEPMSRRVRVVAGQRVEVAYERRERAPTLAQTPAGGQNQPAPQPAQQPATPAGGGAAAPAASQLARLQLALRPPATLFIDGSSRGERGTYNDSLLPGTHTLRAVKDGFVTWDTTITVTAGQTTRIIKNLEPRP
jgi:predicted Ser/Thr protein kinase